MGAVPTLSATGEPEVLAEHEVSGIGCDEDQIGGSCKLHKVVQHLHELRAGFGRCKQSSCPYAHVLGLVSRLGCVLSVVMFDRLFDTRQNGFED